MKLDKANIAKDKISPFEVITKSLQMNKGPISNKEILASYFEKINKDLAKNLVTEVSDDISMAIIGSTSNEDACAAGKAQSTSGTEVNIEEIEDFLQN